MIAITGENLTIEDLDKIARSNEKIKLSRIAFENIRSSYGRLLHLAKTSDPLYGINTGYGIFANKRISLDENKKLTRNLIFSHAVGTGEPLSEEIIRAAIAVRINTLAKGFSGVKLDVVSTLVEMLNKSVIPQVYSQGSLGSSGDLCLLAQIGLVLIRDDLDIENDSGKATYKGKLISGKEAMRKSGINRIELTYKDGLALINGATFSAAITALCIADAQALFKIANAALAMSLEAMCGRSGAFHSDIQKLRNIQGQIETAADIRRLIKESSYIDSTNQIQDAYSLRCSPQVHGAIRETERFVKGIITKEINAATDNPLIISDDEVVSGGNFHGEPVGLVADFLSIAFTELGAISERRTFRLLDKNLNNGLPDMLVDSSKGEGLNSGVMILQYTAAALALENQTLATPDTIKSLPTSANQEDHNANAYNAARNLWKIIRNTTKILAIELYIATRGLDLRKKTRSQGKMGTGTHEIYTSIRDIFPYHENDIQWGFELESLYDLFINSSDLKNKILSVFD